MFLPSLGIIRENVEVGIIIRWKTSQIWVSLLVPGIPDCMLYGASGEIKTFSPGGVRYSGDMLIPPVQYSGEVKLFPRGYEVFRGYADCIPPVQ